MVVTGCNGLKNVGVNEGAVGLREGFVGGGVLKNEGILLPASGWGWDVEVGRLVGPEGTPKKDAGAGVGFGAPLA